jgi:hypothetical protein
LTNDGGNHRFEIVDAELLKLLTLLVGSPC